MLIAAVIECCLLATDNHGLLISNLAAISVIPKFFIVPRDRIELPTQGFSVNYPELPNLLN